MNSGECWSCAGLGDTIRPASVSADFRGRSLRVCGSPEIQWSYDLPSRGRADDSGRRLAGARRVIGFIAIIKGLTGGD
jgi:hypothetical protein